jgi:hypothetical protein
VPEELMHGLQRMHSEFELIDRDSRQQLQNELQGLLIRVSRLTDTYVIGVLKRLRWTIPQELIAQNYIVITGMSNPRSVALSELAAKGFFCSLSQFLERIAIWFEISK